VVITDTPPEGTTYGGNLSCSVDGVTVLTSCSYDPSEGPRGTVTVVADIAPDFGALPTAESAQNELLIQFDVTVDQPEEEQTFENQATLVYDADNDGIDDFIVLSDDPQVLGDEDPAVVEFTPLAETGRAVIATVATGTVIAMMVLFAGRRTQGD